MIYNCKIIFLKNRLLEAMIFYKGSLCIIINYYYYYYYYYILKTYIIVWKITIIKQK